MLGNNINYMGTLGPPDTYGEDGLHGSDSGNNSTKRHLKGDSSDSPEHCDKPLSQTVAGLSPLSPTRPESPSPSPPPGIPRLSNDGKGASYRDDTIVPAKLREPDWNDSTSDSSLDDTPRWGMDKESLDEGELKQEAKEHPDPSDLEDSDCSLMSSSLDTETGSPVMESRSPESNA